MIKVLIVDDDKNALIVLEKMLMERSQVQLVGLYTDPMKALEDLIDDEIDVVFLDIDIPPYNGIELANKYLDASPQTEIVFVTAHSQFAIEAFELNAVDYLLKPVMSKRLDETLKRLEKKDFGSNSETIYINAMGTFNLVLERGNSIKWRTKKSKELFAFMWLHKQRNVDKEVLLESLYPNWPKDKANDNFNTVLYQLRRSMQPRFSKKFIEYSSGTYRMDCDIASDYDELKSILSSSTFSLQTIDKIKKLYPYKLMEFEGYDWVKIHSDQLHKDVIKYLEYQLNQLEIQNILYLETCKLIYHKDRTV